MKYLSIDIEATGLQQNDRIIEFAAVPFDTQTSSIDESLAFHYFIRCPSFEELKIKLDPWVIEHNESLIRQAHDEGLELSVFKQKFEEYLLGQKIKSYFATEKRIVLFGKSMNAIDLPFMTRDLSWEFMQKHFSHRILDLSSTAYSLVDMKLLPPSCESGSGLMKHLGLGDVCHTALEDAVNTARMYLKLLQTIKASSR